MEEGTHITTPKLTPTASLVLVISLLIYVYLEYLYVYMYIYIYKYWNFSLYTRYNLGNYYLQVNFSIRHGRRAVQTMHFIVEPSAEHEGKYIIVARSLPGECEGVDC